MNALQIMYRKEKPKTSSKCPKLKGLSPNKIKKMKRSTRKTLNKNRTRQSSKSNKRKSKITHRMQPIYKYKDSKNHQKRPLLMMTP